MHLSIGQRLRAARESSGKSLLDIAHETRISPARLQMLESDNYAAFGSMAYAKAFLKSYARYLEVDARDAVAGLPQPVLGGPADYRYLTETHGHWVSRQQAHRPGVPARQLRRGSRSPLPSVVVMLVVCGLMTALLGAQLVEWKKTTDQPAADVTEAASKGSSQTDASTVANKTVDVESPKTAPAVEWIDGPQEIRPAVLPKTTLAPPGPDTPVRRPEIVN